MNTTTPVHASELLKSVFDRDERLVDIIASHSPQLAKLRHSPMRHIMVRVTTVAQAARLCGIPADALVNELNGALGIASDTGGATEPVEATVAIPVASESAPRPDWTRGAAVELDVREDLRNGQEPFSKIMAAFATLGEGEVLHLRATFEPVPLFAVMDKRGFVHSSEQHAAEDWSVWFHRPRDAAKPAEVAPAAQTPLAASPIPDALTEMRIDVRGMEPPEPMLRTLEALEALPAACMLLHVNSRVPQLLLPILRERGFDFQIDETRPPEVHVRIWRSSPELGTPSLAVPSPTPSLKEPYMSAQPATPSSSARVRELDVRPIPPRDKHPTIFNTFDSLTPGEAMILINDHDPKPLRYQLVAEHPDTFEWTYLEEGPAVWRVRIDRK
jgi:uncharacterized protein (DUF2249 family)